MSDTLYTESQLLQRIAEGDERAFQTLVHTYSDKVFFHAMTFVKTWQQAGELTQDIFLHIWQKRDKLSAVADLDNYLFIVSKNYLLSFIRKKVRSFEAVDVNQVDVAELSQSLTSQIENRELAALLDKAIDQLPEQKKHVFTLIHHEGLTQEQVSQKLGIATRTVRWNLVSATNGIRDYLHRYSMGELFVVFVILANFLQKIINF